MTPPRTARWAAWALGFFVLFNPYLIPGSESGPRLTDLLGGALGALLVAWLLAGRSVDTRVLARVSAVALLVLVWMLCEVVRTGEAPPILALRWLFAAPYAYAMWHLAREPGRRRALVLGLFWGAVANLAVVVLQRFGYDDVVVSLGLASPRFETRWAKVGGVIEVRPFGMWGHPNAASGVIVLAFPFIAGLVDEGRIAAKWIVAGLLVVFLGSALTLTRSGMLVTAPLIPLWALGRQGPARQRVGRLAFLAAIGLAGLVIGPPGGWERWTDQRNVSSNSGERMQATVESLFIALRNPLGVGDADYQRVLIEATGIPATHNAWMFLAVVAGLPLTLLVLQFVARHALSLARRRTVEGWLALQVIGLFMFEEFFRATVFVILTMWLVAAPAAARLRRPVPAAAGGVRPGLAPSLQA